MSSKAEDLPQELWTEVLQQVDDDRQRLLSCAVVSQKLAKAAAAATHVLNVSFFHKPQCHGCVARWINSHSRFLTRLYLGHAGPIRELPCPNLLELQLCGKSSDAQCAGSRELVLSNTTLFEEGAVWLAGAVPAAVARLQHLDVCIDMPEEPELAVRTDQALTDCLGPHLSALTFFNLNDAEAVLDILQPSRLMQYISTIVSLQHLSMAYTGPYTAANLPGIERLTALQDLELWSGEFEPSCLLHLTRLCLGMLWPPGQGQVQQDSVVGTSQLLHVLARLRACGS